MFSTSRSNQVPGIIARRGVPLSRGQGSRQTILLARRTRTMKLCSFDARSEGQSGDSLEGKVGKNRKDRVGLLCSRNAHARKVLVGRAQWEAKQATLLLEAV